MATNNTTKKTTRAKTSKKLGAKKTTRRKKTRAADTPSSADANQQPLGETMQRADTKGAGVAQHRLHNAVAWIALLLGGLALCASGVVWYLTVGDVQFNSKQQQLRVDRITQRVDEFDATQSDNNNTVSQLKNQLNRTTDDFSKQIKTIQNKMLEQQSATAQVMNTQADDFRRQFNTLSDLMVKLRAELGRGVDSWTLEEAEQLIFVANQHAQFSGQFSNGNHIAKRALQYADALLQKLADPSLNAVRRLLTAEITALDNVKVVNTVSVLNTLSTLSDTVENLALAGDIVIPEKTAAITSDTVSAQDSSNQTVSGQPQAEISGNAGISYIQPIIDAGASFLSGMADLIQVEKNGKPIKPVISAELRQMIYQRPQLILESAQIAFIRQQPDLYRNRIQAARSWVEQHFDSNADATVNWLARLDDVGAISQAKTPDISASLQAIRAILNRRNQ